MFNSYGITTKIDLLGRITVPMVFRKDLGWEEAGTQIVICRTDNGLMLMKKEDAEEKDE